MNTDQRNTPGESPGHGDRVSHPQPPSAGPLPHPRQPLGYYVPDPGYTLAPPPEVAWSFDARRSSRISWLLLLVILVFQAALSLRLQGRAFEDEALYIAAGHLELNHLQHGTPVPDFGSFFSGHPMLYPVLAAMVDSLGGLGAVRLLSMAFMLLATVMLFIVTRRLFNERAALGAAALFSVVQSTIFLGNFATFDAAALFLLSLAAAILVRTDRAHPALAALAAPVAVLAMGVKYAAGLYLPTLVALAVLATPALKRGRAALRGVVFGVSTAVLLVVAAVASGSLSGLSQTTTARAHGTDTAYQLFYDSAQWGGLVFLTAVGGAIAYVRRSRMGEMPWAASGTTGRRRRVMLGVVLCATALLAPAYQSYLHTEISLFKHVGFGLLFAAPMAGLGLSRLVGPHFRHPQLGIMLYVLVLTFGTVQSHHEFTPPDSTRMVEEVRRLATPKTHYLAEEYEIPAYYLRDVSTWDQWQSTFDIAFTDKDGKQYHGPEGFKRAVKAHQFDVIVLTGGITPDADTAIIDAVKADSSYRLVASLPFHTQYGDGAYRIWARQ